MTKAANYHINPKGILFEGRISIWYIWRIDIKSI